MDNDEIFQNGVQGTTGAGSDEEDQLQYDDLTVPTNTE